MAVICYLLTGIQSLEGVKEMKEDTVMSYSEVVQAVWQSKDYDMRGRKVSRGMVDAICKTQAEISFLAGAEEVVDWIEHNVLETCCEYGDYSCSFDRNSWQAQLKEWGVENGCKRGNSQASL